MTADPAASRHLALRPDWLSRHQEAPLDPSLPIVDPHHHFWREADPPYDAHAFATDLACGHNIVATVYVEGHQGYRTTGDPALHPVGETESVVAAAPLPAPSAASSAAQSGQPSTAACPTPRIAAGIVMHADLMLGASVAPVLDAQIEAGRGRVRGLRYSTVSHPDPAARGAMLNRAAGLMSDPTFRAGVAALHPRGLSFDAWIYHTQIHELADLARAFPDTIIVLDHLGGVLGIGPYAGRRQDVFQEWRTALRSLAACPNARIKIGGMGMRLFAFCLEARPEPPTSVDLAAAWRPYVETAIELFGPARAMFESNFPVDKQAYAYGIAWNAFKRLTAGATAPERAALFHDTAAATYRL